jgi:hypothetical protein
MLVPSWAWFQIGLDRQTAGPSAEAGARQAIAAALRVANLLRRCYRVAEVFLSKWMQGWESLCGCADYLERDYDRI